jgi:type II secretory ATPase GspE/PulE/Tfp pilus assembly ATPase PilB-like protein
MTSADTLSLLRIDATHTAVEAIERILTCAVTMKASDIHCDVRATDLQIRFRVDGVMEEVGVVARNLHDEFIARLKILSGSRTDLHVVPQDGRWKAEISGKQFHIRISFMPTYHGENAVLRLLPVHPITDITFSKLGFIPDHVRMIDAALNKTHGLILAVGPTGSGKTTTLHTCLSTKSREPVSIITLEDPVEYEMPGVRQVHISHSHGVSFANGLRASLRQDPDVIMVGEIRDSETAQVAVHTALTGHLVFSTLHTNSAIETIPRLLDMGVDHYLLASTLKLIIGQRLVRTICKACDCIGCPSCRGSGYFGRSVLAEVCEIDKEFAEKISERVSAEACLEYARSRGFRQIMDDGLEKVEWGVTTREEVLRVLYE